MSTLTNRRILLGVSGGIAAYKSAELIRRLQDAGAEVRVVMTRAAQEFITPLTLQALSGNPVHTDLLDPAAEAAMGHIELARWADLIIVAPASADCLARLAQGKGDDLLATVCLAGRCPMAVAPAMNQAMWHNPATEQNLSILTSRGFHQIGPDNGGQACGDVGFGRMSDPEELAATIAALFNTRILEGKRVVVTAGPTREALDPVRYLSNHSSGKMGYAIAQAAVDAGALTTLISGPTALKEPERVDYQAVVSALDMHHASIKAAKDCDIFIATAAVADYRPIDTQDYKIKKDKNEIMQLALTLNPDIVASVARLSPRPFVVGFAAETQNVKEYARDKLARKNLDMIIANDVSDPSIGFNSDHNKICVISNKSELDLPLNSKTELAREIIAKIAEFTD